MRNFSTVVPGSAVFFFPPTCHGLSRAEISSGFMEVRLAILRAMEFVNGQSIPTGQMTPSEQSSLGEFRRWFYGPNRTGTSFVYTNMNTGRSVVACAADKPWFDPQSRGSKPTASERAFRHRVPGAFPHNEEMLRDLVELAAKGGDVVRDELIGALVSVEKYLKDNDL